MRENELKHYGVLGMHWGVRRYQQYGQGGYTPKNPNRIPTDKQIEKAKSNVSNAFKKSSQYSDRNRAKADAKRLKATKINNKAINKLAKARNTKQIQKGYKLQVRANKLNRSAVYLDKSNKKWIKAMEKSFKNVYISDVSDEALEIGKKYTYMLLKK